MRNIVRLEQTGSTNNFALDLLAKGHPPDGTVVIAHTQSAGRGLDQNMWESEPGANLTFSVIVFPEIPVQKQFSLNEAVALAIAAYLSENLKIQEVKIKWPNDIYIGNRKVCGILIQNAITGHRFDFSVIGIGLNVNQVVFSSGAPNPVSLALATGRTYNLDEVFFSLMNSFDYWYYLLQNEGEQQIKAAYRQAMFRFGEFHSYKWKGALIKAKITGISPFGQLCLNDDKNNEIFCDLKELKFIL